MKPQADSLFKKRALYVPGTVIAYATISGGSVRFGSTHEIEPHAQFQIGSVTKLFTGALLGIAIAQRRTAPETTIGEIWTHRKLPAYMAAITLRELATHTSGLPRLPADLKTSDRDIYRGYSEARLFSSLESLSLGQILEGRGMYCYSNFGFGLLGLSVARIFGLSFEEALKHHVFSPLGMQGSFVLTPEKVASTLLQGHSVDGDVAPAWTFDAISPAGGVVCTCSDLARFAEAALAGIGDVGEALRLIAGEPISSGGALAWATYGSSVRWHNGRTNGFSAMLAIDFSSSEATIALWNAASVLDDVCLYLLGAVDQPLEFPSSVALPASAIADIDGSYDGRCGPFRIESRNGAFYLSGQAYGSCRLYALSADQFFAKAFDAKYECVWNERGSLVGLDETFGRFPKKLAIRDAGR